MLHDSNGRASMRYMVAMKRPSMNMRLRTAADCYLMSCCSGERESLKGVPTEKDRIM